MASSCLGSHSVAVLAAVDDAVRLVFSVLGER